MHGIGNDYVYVDCTKKDLAHTSEIAKYVSDRHFGIGSDLFLLSLPRWQISIWKCIMLTAQEVQCAETESAVWQSMSMIII